MNVRRWVPLVPLLTLPVLSSTTSPTQACEMDSRSPAASILPGNPYGAQSPLEGCNEVVTHGQAGVGAIAEFFMELAPYHAEYQPIWEGTLDWIASTAEPQSIGAAWPWAYCDGVSQELSYIVSIWNAEALTRGYLLNGNAAYLSVIDDALAWVDSQKHVLVPNTCIWIESVENHEFSFTALFGVASFLRYNLEIYRATGNPVAAELAHCSAQALVLGRTEDPLGAYWGGAPKVGFCTGSSGIIEALIEADLTFGDTNPEYGVTAKLGLDYLIATKDESEAGYKWGGVATDPSIADAKVGSGVSAVGRAFLAAYDAYGDLTYFDHARGAADWVLSQAESPAPDQLKWSDGNDVGGTAYRTSWCRGTAGVAHFLYNVTQAGAPKVYSRAATKAANFLAATQVPTPSGPVMVQYEGSEEVTTDFIWGLSGLVNPIWQPASGFALRPPLSEVVENAANWFIATKNDDNGLYSWPYNADADGIPLTRPERSPDAFDLRVHVRPDQQGYEVSLDLGSTVAGGNAGSAAAGRDGLGTFAIGTRGSGTARSATAGPESGGLDSRLGEFDELKYQVFDVGGRSLAEGSVANSALSREGDTVSFRWDARDRSGRLLPRGAYVMNVQAGSLSRGVKIAVVH